MNDDGSTDRALLARLSLEEKVSLLSGKEFWSLPALPAIGLEAIVTSDGPTGVKGSGEPPVQGPIVPCGTALAATWSPGLVEEVGSLLGEAARAKGVHVLLAPATNILRSPLAGRNFEYYSEDPFLAGTMTCAYVRGVQSEGVAATVKHFICNDAESSRESGSVEIEEQPLREIYLLPFETAVRDAGVWAVMCSYNRLRGTYMSAHPLLDDLLRGEWGFTGVVVSDWGAVHDTVASGVSGLDIEMPGPPVFRGDKLVAAVRSGEVPERTIDEKVLRILRLARRTGALGGHPPERRPRRSPSEAAGLLRRIAAESFVLLKNDRGLLPLAPGSRIAVLGRLAALPPLQGGGSSNVGPLVTPSPLDCIHAVAGSSAEIRYEPGYVPVTTPRLDLGWVEAMDGSAGFTVEFHEESDPAGPPIEVQTQRTDRFIFREVVAGRRLADLVVSVRATLTPPLDGEYVLAVNCAGAATLRIDGKQVLELGPEHSLDWSYLYRPESRVLVRVALEGGKPVAFELDYRMTPGPGGEIGLITLRAQPPEPDDLLPRAVEAARAADVAVVVAGLGEEHESEGYDRSSLDLPQEQRELIAAVAAANPSTVVVLSAGAPVSLDWAERVAAVLLVWYAGQELGAALADVLMGQAEPGGRLPMTLPARPEDTPVLDPAPDDAEADAWHYREGLFIGYRHFDRFGLEPAYCFGHGLGYTRFSYEEMRVERNGRGDLGVTVRIRNRGERRGKEVVQLYAGAEDPSRPRLELKAFERIDLDPGAEGKVTFTLGERAFSRWDSEAGRFALIPGRHEIAVGSSSRDLPLRESVTFTAEPVRQPAQTAPHPPFEPQRRGSSGGRPPASR
jgi:beta-glucosidase